MSGTLRISICDPNEGTRDNLKKYLIGMDKVWLEADCSRYEFFTEIVREMISAWLEEIEIVTGIEKREVRLSDETLRSVQSSTEGMIRTFIRGMADKCWDGCVSRRAFEYHMQEVLRDKDYFGHCEGLVRLGQG